MNGISKPLALAARTSASYPVAFEPSWLPIGENVPEDLDDYAKFDSSRFAFDGGILANKPLNRTLEAIFEQKVDIPVDRKLIYVVPVRGAKTSSEKPDKKKAPRITQMLGNTVSIPLSQSLRDDLEEIRDHANKMVVQQSNRKSWLVGLPPQVRSIITAEVWDQFRKGRARASARYTLSKALQRRAESELRPVLQRSDPSVDAAIGETLHALGTSVLWVDDFAELPERLGEMYESTGSDWSAVF